MKASNMVSSKGNPVPNQFWIDDGTYTYFQSYSTIIAKYRNIDGTNDGAPVWLDAKAWDYSKTTAKYRNQFLGMTTKEIKQAIKDGTIELVDLNTGGSI